jgi:hypothetical protein
MLLATMLCFSDITISGNQMTILTIEKILVNDKKIITNPL